MSALEVYAIVVLPLILAGLAYGAVKLSDRDAREFDRRGGR